MARLIVTCEFPFDAQRAMELAVLRTFGIPAISRQLVRSGMFLDAPSLRVARTQSLLTALVEQGYSGRVGAEMLARIDRAHDGMPRDTDPMRFVLATFVFEPSRWVRRFGWRPLLDTEERAAFLFWRAVGGRLGIGVPERRDAFERFYDDYQAREMVFAPENQRLAESVRDHRLARLPVPAQVLGRHVMHGLIDDRLRLACGLPSAPPAIAAALPSVIRMRGKVASVLCRGMEPVTWA